MRMDIILVKNLDEVNVCSVRKRMPLPKKKNDERFTDIAPFFVVKIAELNGRCSRTAHRMSYVIE